MDFVNSLRHILIGFGEVEIFCSIVSRIILLKFNFLVSLIQKGNVDILGVTSII